MTAIIYACRLNSYRLEIVTKEADVAADIKQRGALEISNLINYVRVYQTGPVYAGPL